MPTRSYETMVIIDAALPDASVENTISRFEALVNERGGEIGNVDKWGRRRLASEIEGRVEGFYAIFTYAMDSDKRAELDAALPFVDGLLRAKTVVPEYRTRRPE